MGKNTKLQARALAVVIVLLGHFTFTVPVSAQVYKWMDRHPIQGVAKGTKQEKFPA